MGWNLPWQCMNTPRGRGTDGLGFCPAATLILNNRTLTQGCLGLLVYHHTYLSPIPRPWQPPFLKFYHLKMLCKWNHTILTFRDWLFSHSRIPLRIIQFVPLLGMFYSLLYPQHLEHCRQVQVLNKYLLNEWISSTNRFNSIMYQQEMDIYFTEDLLGRWGRQFTWTPMTTHKIPM